MVGGWVKSARAVLQDAARQSVHKAHQEMLAMTAGRLAVWGTALLAPGLMQVTCGI